MLSTCLPHCIHGANSFSKGSLTQAMLRKPETGAASKETHAQSSAERASALSTFVRFYGKSASVNDNKKKKIG